MLPIDHFLKAKIEKNILDEEFGSLNRHIDDLSTILAAQWNSISHSSNQLESTKTVSEVKTASEQSENGVDDTKSYLERYFAQEMG